MSHDNQRPSGHDSDGGEDFSIEDHGVAHEAAGTDDPYARAERQGWENQPTTLNDDFGDPEAAAETAATEDDDAAPAKSRGGLMLPLLLCVLVLGAGGFAYWQLVLRPGENASPTHQAEALAPSGEVQQQVAVALPTSIPPIPVAEAPALSAAAVSPAPTSTAEVATTQGALSPAQAPDINPSLQVAQNNGSVQTTPVLASNATAPATLPSPPTPDMGLPPTAPLVEMEHKPAVPANAVDIVLPTETPSITLNQKPPVVEMPPLPAAAPVLAETDSKAAKKALESDVVDLKQTVADLNDKLQKMKATAERQDATLLQAQAALKAARTAAKISEEKSAAAMTVTPGTHGKVKQPLHVSAHKTVVPHKKKPDAKKHAVTTAHSKNAVVKQSVASKAKPGTWTLRSVAAGSAWIAPVAAENDLKEVHVGDVVPGVGTIKSIERHEGHWVVQGSIRSLQ
jgi:hypothetical protein